MLSRRNGSIFVGKTSLLPSYPHLASYEYITNNGSHNNRVRLVFILMHLVAILSISMGVKLAKVPTDHCNAIAFDVPLLCFTQQLVRIQYPTTSLDMIRNNSYLTHEKTSRPSGN